MSPSRIADLTSWSQRHARAQRRWPTFGQIRYVSDFFSKKERWIFRIFSTLLIVSAIFLGVRIFQNHVIYLPATGGEYQEGLVGSPKLINPLYAATNDVDQDVAALVYSGLFKEDPVKGFIPDIAEKYELSEDQKVYTLHLRNNVYFHDGQKLNANDVVFTMNAIQDALYGSPLRASFQNVTVARVDDKTVTFTLKEPFAPFLESLTFGILPEHVWIEIYPENARLHERNLRPVGSGPYQLVSLKKDRDGFIKSLSFEPHKKHHGKKPYIEELVLKFYSDTASNIQALQDGNVDGINFLPKSEQENVAKNTSDITFHTFSLPQYTAIFFNQGNPLLKDHDVREALAMAIDKDRILKEALEGEGQIIHGPILPGKLGYNPDIRKYAFESERAKTFLDEKGWKFPVVPEGQEAPAHPVRVKDGKELAFSLTTIDVPEFLETAAIIQKAWEDLGVRVDVKKYSSKELQKKVIKPRDYETLLVAEIVGSDPDPYPFWHSSQNRDPGLNLAVFFNKQADQLLEEARKTSDSEQRRLKYLHFQNILADELPAIFLYNPTYTYPVHRDVRGLMGGALSIPSDRFSTITQWYVETDRQWTWEKK